jgi:hypothetical protein
MASIRKELAKKRDRFFGLLANKSCQDFDHRIMVGTAAILIRIQRYLVEGVNPPDSDHHFFIFGLTQLLHSFCKAVVDLVLSSSIDIAPRQVCCHEKEAAPEDLREGRTAGIDERHTLFGIGDSDGHLSFREPPEKGEETQYARNQIEEPHGLNCASRRVHLYQKANYRDKKQHPHDIKEQAYQIKK